MLYQQPQSGPVDLDLSGPARGTISTLLPVFKSNDMVRTAVLAAPGRFTPTTTPAAFSFTSSSASVIGYTDTDSGQFRRSTFTMVLRFRLNSLTAGSIFNVDSRFNIGVGVESIPAGNLGVSWYDGTFRVLSTTATLGLHTLIAQATTAGMSLWLDGVLIGTTASGAIVYQGGRGCTYGAVDYFGNPGAIFDLQIANYNGLALPSATVSQIAANPWMLLLDPEEDDDLLFATGGASPDVTVAVTGQAATVSAGTLRASTSKALTGQAATAARGTLTATVSKALTGQAGTVSPGALVPTTAKALAGQSSTAAQGSVSTSASAGATLSGQAVTASQGTARASITVALTGQQVTAQRGSVGTSGNKSVALIGSGMAASAGTMVGQVSASAPAGCYVATVMHASPINRSTTALLASIAAQAGTMGSPLIGATVMRAAATNKVGAMRSDAINRTVEFI